MNETAVRRRLEGLRLEHGDLAAALDALTGSTGGDQLRLARLKRRKLALKDEIAALEDSLIPDIIA